eukprot:c26071_g1_i7 orf=1043-1336(+)
MGSTGFGKMTNLATKVAHWLIETVICNVTWFFAVPAQWLRWAFCCYVPCHTAVVTNSFIWAISCIVPNASTIVTDLKPRPERKLKARLRACPHPTET